MIELVIFSALFGVAFLANKSGTYGILLAASLVNIGIYQFTSEYSVIIQATLDFVILSLLIRYADKHFWYQAGLLVLALLTHLQMEIDHATGGNMIFDSYEYAITLITIAQLAGGGYGLIASIFERAWNDHSSNELFDYYPNQVGEKICQKKSQKH